MICNYLYLLLIRATLVPPALVPQTPPHPFDVPRLALAANHVGQGQPPALKNLSILSRRSLTLPASETLQELGTPDTIDFDHTLYVLVGVVNVVLTVLLIVLPLHCINHKAERIENAFIRNYSEI